MWKEAQLEQQQQFSATFPLFKKTEQVFIVEFNIYYQLDCLSVYTLIFHLFFLIYSLNV